MVSKKGLLGWCLYETAVAPHGSIIITLVFAPYFVNSIVQDSLSGTAQWGMTIGITNFIIALLAPFIGAISDLQGRRKPWIAFFTLLCAISCFFLWFSKPNPSFILWSLAWVGLGIIGSEFGYALHGSLLFRIASGNLIAKISGRARALGFLGDLLSLSIVLFLIIQPHTSFLPLDVSASERIRLSCVLVAIWIIVFSLPLFLFTPDQHSTGVGFRKALKEIVTALAQTSSSIWQNRKIFWFFFSSMGVLTGLNCLAAFGGIYFSNHFHLNSAALIYFGIILAFIAITGAFSLGKLDNYLGARKTLIYSLFISSTMIFGLVMIDSLWWFWVYATIAAFFIGVIVGGLRSLLAQIAPPTMMAQIFSLNLVAYKLSAFLGPSIASGFILLFSSQQAGLLVVPVSLLVGAFSLYFVEI